MALVYTDPKNYKDIADSIRNGLGLPSQRVIKPSEMSGFIDKINLYKTDYVEMLSDYRNVILPENINAIKPNMFSGQTNLTAINIPDTAAPVHIGTEAFKGCIRLRSIYLHRVSFISPATSSQYTNIFNGCSKLRYVVFRNMVENNSISNDTFLNCSKLKTIYVPWGNNIVPGAPWGASNASVVYNTNFNTSVSFDLSEYGTYVFRLGQTWRKFIASDLNINNDFSINEEASAGVSAKHSIYWRGKPITYVDGSTYSNVYADNIIIPDMSYSVHE